MSIESDMPMKREEILDKEYKKIPNGYMKYTNNADSLNNIDYTKLCDNEIYRTCISVYKSILQESREENVKLHHELVELDKKTIISRKKYFGKDIFPDDNQDFLYIQNYSNTMFLLFDEYCERLNGIEIWILREKYENAFDAQMADYLVTKLFIQEKKEELRLYQLFEQYGKKDRDNINKLNDKYLNILHEKLQNSKNNHKLIRRSQLNLHVKET